MNVVGFEENSISPRRGYVYTKDESFPSLHDYVITSSAVIIVLRID